MLGSDSKDLGFMTDGKQANADEADGPGGRQPVHQKSVAERLAALKDGGYLEFARCNLELEACLDRLKVGCAGLAGHARSIWGGMHAVQERLCVAKRLAAFRDSSCLGPPLQL